MQYNTSEVDEIFGAATESAPRGYTEALAQIRERIERNLSIMFDFGESLKASAPSRYTSYMSDYNALIATYKKGIEAATKAQYVSPEEQNQMMKKMDSLLAYTTNAVSQLKNAPATKFPEQDVAREGTVTAMVKHDDSVIVMDNVGPLRVFWDGLNPAVKLISKAFVIGGVLYGLKKGYDYMNPPAASTRTANPARRRRRRKPNPIVENDDEE